MRHAWAGIAILLFATMANAQSTLLLIHANFPNVSGSSTQTQRQRAVDDAVGFWREVSHGRIAITATATPNLMMSTARPSDESCPLATIKAEANAAARAIGMDPAGYDYVAYTFPKPPGCAKSGQTFGPRDIYIYANYIEKTPYAHELGHNLGLGHASVIRCPLRTSIEEGKCSSLGEYSDPYNVMSRHPDFGWPSAWALHRMKIIQDSQLARYDGGDQTYVITPLEAEGGVKAVVVPVGNHYIWAEYRTQTGSDIDSSRPEGAILRVASRGGILSYSPATKTPCWDTCMVDLTPATGGTGAGRYDTPLGVGKSWVDLDTTFSVQSIDAGGLTLRVTRSGQVPPPEVPVPARVVEYVHALFGHYFSTSSPEEIGNLDSGVFSGWVRSGSEFLVFPLGVAGTAATCRFFSTAFDPKSSHFYTSSAEECLLVKANVNWQFEGEVFGVLLPDASGNCAPATVPLYRLYNDGQSGAPNHRYTTSLSTRSHMIELGWIPEGSGTLGVIGCVPDMESA